MGLRFFSAYLHDGRAHTIEEAVLSHGGEGSEGVPSVDRFRALSRADRDELLRFVAAL
ncbi:MAG: di-heme oxidoredictase family protein [Polyangiaceae bacterium]